MRNASVQIVVPWNTQLNFAVWYSQTVVL